MNNEKKRILLNTLIYALKQIASVVFPLITFAYASRRLGVSGIGTINYSNSIANYFVILSGLGISTYAIRTGARLRNNSAELNLFITELYVINLISTSIALLLYLFVVFNIGSLMGYRSLLLSFSLLIPFTTLGIEWVYNIFEDFTYITVRSIMFQFVSLILLFVFVKNQDSVMAYADIIVFSSVGSNILNFVHARKYVKPTFRGIRICRHFKPILALFGMTIATTIYTTMDTTMLGAMSGDYQVGLYSAAHKVSKMLILMIATIRTVSLPSLSRNSTQNEEAYLGISNDILNIVVMLAMPIMIGTMTYAEIILTIMSGEKYIKAVPILAFLAVDVFISAISGTLVYQYVLLKKGENWTFLITLIGSAVNLVLNYILILKLEGVGAALATCISELVVFILAFIFSRRYINIRIMIIHVGISFISCIGIIGVKIWVNQIWGACTAANLVSIFICVVLYFLIIVIVGNNVLERTIKKIILRMR